MKTIELTTNIKCAGCVAKVTPVLNKKIGENKWKVDIQNSKKILTVNTGDLSEEQVIKAVNKAGYKAEAVL
jgi:copper chaperone CopZ